MIPLSHVIYGIIIHPSFEMSVICQFKSPGCSERETSTWGQIHLMDPSCWHIEAAQKRDSLSYEILQCRGSLSRVTSVVVVPRTPAERVILGTKQEAVVCSDCQAVH